VLISVLTGLFFLVFSGCSTNTVTEKNSYNNPCKKTVKPKWVDDEYVGVSRITASSSKSAQKKIALQRAITVLLMTKGNSRGTSIVSVQKEFKSSNQKEFYTKSFQENSLIQMNFKDIKYDIKIVNMWVDPCTKEIYIKIDNK